MKPSYKVTKRDRKFFKQELDSFVPDKLYDAHIHLGSRSDYIGGHKHALANTPKVADMKIYRSHINWLVPNRKIVGAMVIPTTLVGKRMEEGNTFVSKESSKDDYSGSSIVVHPNVTIKQLYADIKKYNPISFKPYSLMAPNKTDSFLKEFLPEHIVEVANDVKLPIVVHIVCSKALADKTNQKTIKYYCKKYPDMKMVFAHCGRGYNPCNTINGIKSLSGLNNVYFDNSCVCEAGATEAILNVFGPKKLMWGSDYPFSHLHGRCISIADKFFWLTDGDTSASMKAMRQEYVLIGSESLQALKFACINCKLSESDIKAVFCNNAMKLYHRRKS
jgi:glutamate-1-semialdehyde 2,1-aminomutase